MKATVTMLCAVLFGFGAAHGETSGRIQALLIGVANYPTESIGLKPLAGPVNDATAIASVLRSRFGLSEHNIEELHDSQATREEILAAIHTHLIEQTKPGDTAIFYFAGHGAQVADDGADEGDLLDETIVPYDGRLRGEDARDIRDDELRALFAKLTAAGVHLVVILDSCHSGSGTRARGTARRADPIGAPASDRTLNETQDLLPVPAEAPIAVLLAAARSHELAYETEVDGIVHGVFTRGLVQALQRNRPRATYLDLIAETAARLRGAGTAQRPTAEGDLATLVFDGLQSSRRPVYVGERSAHSKFDVQAGTTVGMTLGSEFRAYKSAAAAAGLSAHPGTPAELIEVSAGHSVAMVDMPQTLREVAYFVETKRVHTETNVAIALSGLGETAVAGDVREAISIVSGVDEANEQTLAHLQIVMGQTGVDVLRNDGSPVYEEIDPGSLAVEHFVELFERVLRHEAFMRMANESPSIDLEILPMVIADDERTHRPNIVDGLPSVSVDHRLQFCIKNRSLQEHVFIHLFLVYDEFWIKQVYPMRGANADPVARYVAFTLPPMFKATKPGLPVFRAIVTDEPIPSELLEQRRHYIRDRAPPLCQGTELSSLANLLCKVRDGHRSRPVTVEEWETLSVPIEVTLGPRSYGGHEERCEFE